MALLEPKKAGVLLTASPPFREFLELGHFIPLHGAGEDVDEVVNRSLGRFGCPRQQTSLLSESTYEIKQTGARTGIDSFGLESIKVCTQVLQLEGDRLFHALNHIHSIVQEGITKV